MRYNVYLGREGRLELAASGIDFEFMGNFDLRDGDIVIFEPDDCYGFKITIEKIEEENN